jgi:hypothetical protein
MARELVKLLVESGEQLYFILGAKYFYGDSDIRAATGIKLATERNTDDKRVPAKAGPEVKRLLVRLVAVLAPDSLFGGNAAQGDGDEIKRYEFYCSPEFVGEAMTELRGKAIDTSILPGNYKIQQVYRKAEISVA